MKYLFLSIILVGFLFSQDFEEIDSNLENRNFEDVIIPLNKLNIEYPQNLDILVRLSAAHHLLSEKTYDKKMDSYHFFIICFFIYYQKKHMIKKWIHTI